MAEGASNIGLIGLGVMGANVARNIGNQGYTVSVYNRTGSVTEELIAKKYPGLVGFTDISEFVQSLERPRKVCLMVQAGDAVDAVIAQIKPMLEPGDIIIDLGNSHWKDTITRQERLQKEQIYFVGCGVSGGEEGALKGPSIMPGGHIEAVNAILPIFENIAAKDFSGNPCVTHVGKSGAGHFVKMVHNGIEYAIMQAISEIYGLLISSGYSNAEIHDVFEDINTGKNESFLLDITVKIFESFDEYSDDGSYLVDKIEARAGAKGTGRWTVESALELGVAVPSISQAVFARILSARNQKYTVTAYASSEIFESVKPKVSHNLDLQKAMELVFVSCYMQGLDLIAHANDEFGWNIDISEVIRIWEGGCIIRSKHLPTLYEVWKDEVDLFGELTFIQDAIAETNTAMPVLNSVVDYALGLSSDFSPVNLIQAQRDFFGAHTYNRTDKDGTFTGGWQR